MPPKGTSRHRTPKKADAKGNAGWLACDGSSRLLCEVEDAYVEPGVRICGVLQLADEAVVPNAGPKQDHYVFLHPKTMEACQISIGDNVVLASDKKKVACSAWPSASIKLASVAAWMPSIRSLSLSAGAMVDVSKLRGELCLAKQVTLSSSQALPASFGNVFKRYLSRLLDRRLLFLTNHIEVDYCGQAALLSVTDFVSASGDIQVSASAPSTPHTPLSMPQTPTQLSSSSFASQPSAMSTPQAVYPAVSPASANRDGAEADLSSSLVTDLSSLSLKDREHPQAGNSPHCGGNSSLLATATDFSFVMSATETEIVLDSPGEQASNSQLALNVTFADVGGLKQQIADLRRYVYFRMKVPEEIKSAVLTGVTLGYHVLLHGPAGTGKMLLIRALLTELALPHVFISADSILSLQLGEGDNMLSETFAKAQRHRQCIIVIENVDRLCPITNADSPDSQGCTRAKLRDLLSGLSKFATTSQVVVVATAGSLDSVCPSMRTQDTFSVDIEVTPPTADERVQILHLLLASFKHSLTDSDIKRLATEAHGYVSGDLYRLCVEASCRCLERLGRRWQEHGEWPAVDASTSCLLLEDFESGLYKIGASAMRGITLEVPKVRWEDIGGLSQVKKLLRGVVERPLKFPERYAAFGVPRPRGALLYGPPGCSKTMIARALATESGLNFLAVKGPELFSKYVGESERAVREVFRRARAASPSIIFFDEIDALGVKREGEAQTSRVGDRVVAQLLTEMDGVEQLGEVIVIAATNRPDTIDKALLRPGRFDSLVYVPLPDAETRKEIFSLHFRKTPVADDVSLDLLATRTVSFSGAEIVNVVKKAVNEALDAEANSVSAAHFDAALREVKAQTTPDQILMYDLYASKNSLH